MPIGEIPRSSQGLHEGRQERGPGDTEGGSMTDHRNERDDERRQREKTEKEDNRRREHKERRSDELKESWRRNHPSEQEDNERGRRGKGRRA
jgi:hypothetical protein